jgi:hypothetical protein
MVIGEREGIILEEYFQLPSLKLENGGHGVAAIHFGKMPSNRNAGKTKEG